MSRVFLTGGSGYVAAQILEKLIAQGYSVVTSVRSEQKAKRIFDTYPDVPKSKLDVVIVEDISVLGAFDKAVISEPPFDVVLHTASPFRFDVKDIQRDLLDPAILGTTGLLKGIKEYAPSVKRVVITSSTLAIMNSYELVRPGYKYTEEDWNPIAPEFALADPIMGYFGSKTFAERAAWKYVETEKPNFTITCLNPPTILGPVINGDLKALNTSHWFLLEFLTGKHKGAAVIPDNLSYYWVDVRDLADAHIKAIDAEEAVGKRFLFTAGTFTNREVVDVVRKHFPEFRDQLPSKDAVGGDLSKDDMFMLDSSKRIEVFGDEMLSLENSIIGMVKCFKALGL